MKVLEIVSDWMVGVELLEHLRSLQSSSVEPMLGIICDVTNDTEMLLSDLSIRYFDLCRFSLKTYLRNLNNANSSIVDENLADIIQKHKPDIIHFHSCVNALHLYSKVLELSIPYTVSLYSWDIYLSPLQIEDYSSRLCKMLQGAARILVSYDTLASDVKQLCPSSPPINIFNLPIRIPSNTPNAISTNKHLISVGALTWENAFHDLVRAMVHLPDVSLDIVQYGLDVDKRHLVFLIHTYNLQDRVRLLENVSIDQCEELIVKSTAYIHSGITQEPTYHLLLAMALGKPVFATNNRGVDEVIEDKHNGIYIPIGEPIAMAEKFKLLDDTDLMQKIGQNARTTIEKRFTPEIHAKQFIEFYRNAYRHTDS